MPLQVRGFKAAQTDRLSPAAWLSSPQTINEIIRRELPRLRGRSRLAGENDPYARRFKALLRSNVIGPDGVLLLCQVRGPDGTLNKPMNKAVEKAWREWCRPEHCDMAGKTGFAEISRQFIATVAEDGEAILRLVEGAPENSSFGFGVQFIDAERLAIHLDREASPVQNAIRMGIEENAYGKPIAYWFDSKEGDYYYRNHSYERISADEIIHAYLPFRAGARRGVPWTAASLMRLNMLDGFEDAALVAARVGASKIGFFLTKGGDSAPMDGVKESDGTTTISAEPGEFETMPAEVTDFRTFDPAYPNGDFPGFVKQVLRGVSAGLGVSYHKLAGDLEAVNFSSGRLGEQEDREFWKALQNWIINDALHARIFERFLFNALLRRKIPGASMADLDAILSAIAWQPRRWAHIQPREEAAARETALSLRLASRSSYIREDGRDPDDVWDEIAAENEALAMRNINPDLPGAAPIPPDKTATDSQPADPALAA